MFLQFAVIYAKNFGMLLAFRFLTGFFGSPVLATGGATIADIYTPNKQVYGIGVWGISAVFGPALGPLVRHAPSDWLDLLKKTRLEASQPRTKAGNGQYGS